MSRSLDVQSNARGIMIVKNMHKCHKNHAILHKLCTWFGKNELMLYIKEQTFLRLGPAKYVHGCSPWTSSKMLYTRRPCAAWLKSLMCCLVICSSCEMEMRHATDKRPAARHTNKCASH